MPTVPPKVPPQASQMTTSQEQATTATGVPGPAAPSPSTQATKTERPQGFDPFENSEGIPKEFRERVNADKIPCPALLSLYNNGDLKPAADGTVNMEELDGALTGLGLGPSVRNALMKVADGTDKAPDTFNLFNLRDSNIDHSGSTGIRDPKVDPEKLDTFLGFATDGRLYADNLAKATAHFNTVDPGLKGTAIETLEMSALLQVFGREDPEQGGARYFTNDDVKGMWLDGKYPEDWSARPKDDIGLGEVGLVSAKIGVTRLWDAITTPIKNFFASIFS